MSKEYLKELRSKALSSEDLKKLTYGDARILTYPEITKYKNIDQVFGDKKAVILLYITTEDNKEFSIFGHWIALIKHKNNLIEVFDPYGISIDSELKWRGENFRKEHDQWFPHLTYLLANGKYNVEFNNTKLQSSLKDTNTCGRHAGVRVNLRRLSLEQYVKLMKSTKYSPDDVVTILTADI